MSLSISEPCPTCGHPASLVVMMTVKDDGKRLTLRVQCYRCFQNFHFVTGDRSLTPVDSLVTDGGTVTAS